MQNEDTKKKYKDAQCLLDRLVFPDPWEQSKPWSDAYMKFFEFLDNLLELHIKEDSLLEFHMKKYVLAYRKSKTSSWESGKCPHCRHKVQMNREKRIITNFCPVCGQALIWGRETP